MPTTNDLILVAAIVAGIMLYSKVGKSLVDKVIP